MENDSLSPEQVALRKSFIKIDALREENELLKLRIQKLEAVNLPVIVHCNCPTQGA